MSERSHKVLLEDILEAIERILSYTKDLDEASFLHNTLVQDAVSRNFTVIGEATSRISDDFKQTNNIINWRSIKDFRNKIIHDYMGVDYKQVWNIISEDIPLLKSQIESIIQ